MIKSVLLFINLYAVLFLTKVVAGIYKGFRFFRNETVKQVKSVLYLDLFPQTYSSGYMWRVKSWADVLENNSIRVNVFTFIKDHKIFFNVINDEKKLPTFLIKSMWQRFFQIIKSQNYSVVIVRRELLLFNEYGNLFMEKFLLSLHSNVILDFDDDISAAKKEPRNISKFGKLMKEHNRKFSESLKLYKRFIVGSDYLKEKILMQNRTVKQSEICVIPTCVNYNSFSPRKYVDTKNENVIFGWLGGNQNLPYLDMLIEPLNSISKNINIKLIVVAGKDYINKNARFKIENYRWSLNNEKELIRKFDIGVMPIKDNLVGRGKCGFKLIQYMGLGVVSIATDVTINGQIIKDGINGFLVKPDNSNWEDVLTIVLKRRNDFSKIGEEARKTIENSFTFDAKENAYLSFVTKTN